MALADMVVMEDPIDLLMAPELAEGLGTTIAMARGQAGNRGMKNRSFKEIVDNKAT